MGFRVVSDSSSNVFDVEGLDYATVPLKVMFDSREYPDVPETDAVEMVAALQSCTGPSTTSCPNVQEWLDAFGDASQIIGITISSGLSGSYESAELARRTYLEQHPQAQVYVHDSRGTGPHMQLVIEKIRELEQRGLAFDEVVAAVQDYAQRTHILFALESLANLARNGRVSAAVARIAGVLNVRFIGRGSDDGIIETVTPARGEKRTLKAMVAEMASRGFAGGKVRISHCVNPGAANELRLMLLGQFPESDISINACTALCSYYADKGGIIVGYEGALRSEVPVQA